MIRKILLGIFLTACGVVVFACFSLGKLVRVLYEHSGNRPVIDAIRMLPIWNYIAPVFFLGALGGVAFTMMLIWWSFDHKK